jgi:uncharacterized protein YbbK (DUF523 family)
MILVSGCLVGINCKYDGGNNYDERIFNLVKEGKAIPICPEQLGGLKTPRNPAEIQNKDGERKVVTCEGDDVTIQYKKGAEEALKIAKQCNCHMAILKEKSPSCGTKNVYDGTFSKKLISGMGICAQLLHENGIEVHDENEFL